jgi:hypothetical protein
MISLFGISIMYVWCTVVGTIAAEHEQKSKKAEDGKQKTQI